MSFTLNIHKTKALHQPGLPIPQKCPDGQIDEEIQHCLKCASTAFGRLRKRVFENNKIRSNTKLMVYRDVVVPALLYGSETWTAYSRHLKELEQYHQRSLCKITLGDRFVEHLRSVHDKRQHLPVVNHFN
eukprot:g39446.t1